MRPGRSARAHSVCYFDYTGSGAETIAHLRENQRITLMFCAFAGPPKIFRLHGKGEILRTDHKDWPGLAKMFGIPEEARAIIRVAITRVSDSCGFGVPLMEFKAERDSFAKWNVSKTAKDIADYRRTKNAKSIDGLLAWEEPTKVELILKPPSNDQLHPQDRASGMALTVL